MTESVIVRMPTSLAEVGRASHFVGRGGWDALRPKRSGTAVPLRSCAHGASASARTYCGSRRNCDRTLSSGARPMGTAVNDKSQRQYQKNTEAKQRRKLLLKSVAKRLLIFSLFSLISSLRQPFRHSQSKNSPKKQKTQRKPRRAFLPHLLFFNKSCVPEIKGNAPYRARRDNNVDNS